MALVAKHWRHYVIFLCTRVTVPRLYPKMTKSCACVGCTNRFQKGSSITFHILPSKETRKDCHERWVQVMRRINPDGTPWRPGSKYTYVCSEHFLLGETYIPVFILITGYLTFIDFCYLSVQMISTFICE